VRQTPKPLRFAWASAIEAQLQPSSSISSSCRPVPPSVPGASTRRCVHACQGRSANPASRVGALAHERDGEVGSRSLRRASGADRAPVLAREQRRARVGCGDGIRSLAVDVRVRPLRRLEYPQDLTLGPSSGPSGPPVRGSITHVGPVARLTLIGATYGDHLSP
jgi:hypothetical protein